MKKYIVALMAVLVCGGAFAQGEMDAIRLSSGDLQGTARGQAMGGAFGALGGDVTGIGINPAGLGVYRSSEVNFTTSLQSVGMKTNWEGSISKENKAKLAFDNASYVGYYPLGSDRVSALNFSFSYNRLKNFDRQYSASGTGMGSSISDYIATISTSKGIPQAKMNYEGQYDPYMNPNVPWISTLGWLGYLMNDELGKDSSYIGLFPNDKVSPRLDVRESGHIETFDLSLAMNILDMLYFGMTVGFTDIKYELNSSYGETFSSGGNIGLNNYFHTEGSGYQLSLGGIWRPADWLRLGASFHSPTWYTMTDRYKGISIANYLGVDPSKAQNNTPDNAWTYYRFHTPASWVFSIAGIIGTKGIISLDYEGKNYRTMKLLDNQGIAKKDVNAFIKEDYKSASTLRAGLEYRITPQFSARLGYSNVQNPYEKTFGKGGREVVIVGTVPHYTLDGDVNYFTTGIGYRFSAHFYIDAAFVYRTQKDSLYFFSPIPASASAAGLASTPASVTHTAGKGLITIGYKF